MLQNATFFAIRRVVPCYAPSFKAPCRYMVTSLRVQSVDDHLDKTRESLRALLRETAQPVAVVTSLLHTESPSRESTFHGATLSSFTSIALDPHPLIAFSLRVPSRMATSLNAHDNCTSQLRSKKPCHMAINILSASQSHLAHIFSRPDLHPHPFSYAESTEIPFQWTTTKEGLPILSNSLGAISCMLVGHSWSLSDLRRLEQGSAGIDELHTDAVGRGVCDEAASGPSSDLFIARVIRVEGVSSFMEERSLSKGDVHEEDETRARTLPLLYHRRRYGTVSDIPPLFPKS